jgi:hypothetical protein
LAYALAIRFVEAIDRNKSGREKQSDIDPAGPRAANSMELVRPMKDASIRDMRGGHAYIPSAGNAKDKHSRIVGVGG